MHYLQQSAVVRSSHSKLAIGTELHVSAIEVGTGNTGFMNDMQSYDAEFCL
jgi:hypothetical protein